MTFENHSGIYTLKTVQVLPVSLGEAWDFFSDPANLAKITPKQMGFDITSANTEKMYPGQIITYKVGIFPGVKTNWVTEITHVKFQEYFVDEQRAGPYKMWHHEHHFREIAGGVEMKDKLSFIMPFGFLGTIAFHMGVQKKLAQIFTFRQEYLSKSFG